MKLTKQFGTNVSVKLHINYDFDEFVKQHEAINEEVLLYRTKLLDPKIYSFN